MPNRLDNSDMRLECTSVKHHISGFGCIELGMDASLWIIPNFLSGDVKQGVLTELRQHDASFQRPIGAYGSPDGIW